MSKDASPWPTTLRPAMPDVGRYLEYNELNTGQRQDIRAAQRTFQGAYMRTALAELAFGLMILRLFNREFLPVGTVYTVHALFMMCLSMYMRRRGVSMFLHHVGTKFVTNGGVVLVTALLAIAAQLTLLILLIRL